jgi:hypothetical protein
MNKSDNVKEIVINYLRANGFDGLYNDDCGCSIDDLCPCVDDWSDCRPGIALYGADIDEEGNMWIGPKPEK